MSKLSPMYQRENVLFRVNLVRLKKARGATWEEVAKAIGTPCRNIYFYLNGQRNPTFATVCRFSDYFCVSTEEFRRETTA